LHAGSDFFVIEEMESGEADVGDFFFTKRDRLTRCKAWRVFDVGWRHSRCRCASPKRKAQPCGSQRWYGDLGYSLPFS